MFPVPDYQANAGLPVSIIRFCTPMLARAWFVTSRSAQTPLMERR